MVHKKCRSRLYITKELHKYGKQKWKIMSFYQKFQMFLFIYQKQEFLCESWVEWEGGAKANIQKLNSALSLYPPSEFVKWDFFLLKCQKAKQKNMRSPPWGLNTITTIRQGGRKGEGKLYHKSLNGKIRSRDQELSF